MTNKKRRRRLAPVADVVRAVHPDADVAELVAHRRLIVDGVVVQNARALVRSGASVRVVRRKPLRGQLKLGHALRVFGVDARGSTALDIGAAAGGFTAALLEAGAVRVYALDAGHGQLRGWLRQDPRVINHEARNISDLSPALVPDRVDIVTMDLSYLAFTEAIHHVGRVPLAPGARLIALVKPTFELRSPTVITDPDDVGRAVRVARSACESLGWTVDATCDAPRTGLRAVEVFLTATA